MNETIRNLMERRSIRKYKNEQIQDAELKAILEAGQYAPTASGRQSPAMVVVQDEKLIQKLAKLNADVMGSDGDPFYGAPTVVIVFADSDRKTYVEDGSLVMGNLLNAAHAIGVDSCWIHRAKEVFESEEGKALLKKWGIAGDYEGVGHVVLGYAAKEPGEPGPRKSDYVVRV